MAIDWGLLQQSNVGANALQGYRQAQADQTDRAEFQARQEQQAYTRQQNALETQRQIATEDQQTRDRHRERAAQLFAGLLNVPEAQRRQAALAAVADLGLNPQEQARVEAVINDPATTWDDQSVRSRVMFLGGDVPHDTYESTPRGLFRIPAAGGDPTLVPNTQPTQPGQRFIRGEGNSIFDTETQTWIYGNAAPARPRAGGGGRGGGGRRSGGGGPSPQNVPSGFVLDN